MKHLKLYEGFFKDMTKMYVPMEMWDEIDKHQGEDLTGTVVSKRVKKSMFGEKFLLGINFDEGFTDEVEFDFPVYSEHKKGDRIRVQL